MNESLLSCNRCGHFLNALEKKGPRIHTNCNHCGMDNSAMIAAQEEREQDEETDDYIPVIRRKVGVRARPSDSVIPA